jgi:2-C-methyl-D-erythritol 2,4-cyclodiphosphate synthase
VSSRTGIGYDSHRFEEGRRLVLGGVEVAGVARGLTGHSDADVLTHAVIDALLGSAGLGDIGQHFPDTDAKWKDADSLDLLSQVAVFLEEHDFRVVHVDASVICESPKLGGLRDEMRRSLAATLSVSARDVNVKFSTNEGMGWLGRGEGIAVLAVATVERPDS